MLDRYTNGGNFCPRYNWDWFVDRVPHSVGNYQLLRNSRTVDRRVYILVDSLGLEPSTNGLKDRCSNQLS